MAPYEVIGAVFVAGFSVLLLYLVVRLVREHLASERAWATLGGTPLVRFRYGADQWRRFLRIEAARHARFAVAAVLVVPFGMLTIFFAMAKPFWDSLSDEEKAAVQAAADAAIVFNNDGISGTEAEAQDFLREKGMTITTPDLDAFREHVQAAYLGSDFSANWPDGMVERINAL